jgi:UrcA family protein
MEWRRESGDSAPRQAIPPFALCTEHMEWAPKLDTPQETAMNRFTVTIMISTLTFGYQLANATSFQDNVPSVVVHFTDLDLTHRDGVAVLYRRLKSAAETVCAAQNGRDLGSQTRFKVCWQGALSTAVTKVDQPALTAHYRAQFNDRNATIQIVQK